MEPLAGPREHRRRQALAAELVEAAELLEGLLAAEAEAGLLAGLLAEEAEETEEAAEEG